MGNPRYKAAKIVADKTLSSRICDGYQPSEGCPPLSSLWGGAPLSGSPWLKKFAESVDEESTTADAWRMLEQKMNKHELCLVIDLLYLYSLTTDTSVEESRERNRVLKATIDSIVPAYDKLIDRLSTLIESSEGKQPLAMGLISDDLRYLISSREQIIKVRNNAAHSGSKKTNARAFYLCMMSYLVEGATRTQQIPVLTDLINAAYAANGKGTAISDEGTLKRRVFRCRKRFAWASRGPYRLPSEKQKRIERQQLLEMQKEYEDLMEFESQQQLESPQQCEVQTQIEDGEIPF
jgi:hypothetical protein